MCAKSPTQKRRPACSMHRTCLWTCLFCELPLSKQKRRPACSTRCMCLWTCPPPPARSRPAFALSWARLALFFYFLLCFSSCNSVFFSFSLSLRRRRGRVPPSRHRGRGGTLFLFLGFSSFFLVLFFGPRFSFTDSLTSN